MVAPLRVRLLTFFGRVPKGTINVELVKALVERFSKNDLKCVQDFGAADASDQVLDRELKVYGNVLSISVDNVPGFKSVSTGNRRARMEMHQAVPNILDVEGHTIRCEYDGVVRLCRKCRIAGHEKAKCVTPRCEQWRHPNCNAPCKRCGGDQIPRLCKQRLYSEATSRSSAPQAQPPSTDSVQVDDAQTTQGSDKEGEQGKLQNENQSAPGAVEKATPRDATPPPSGAKPLPPAPVVKGRGRASRRRKRGGSRAREARERSRSESDSSEGDSPEYKRHAVIPVVSDDSSSTVISDSGTEQRNDVPCSICGQIGCDCSELLHKSYPSRTPSPEAGEPETNVYRLSQIKSFDATFHTRSYWSFGASGSRAVAIILMPRFTGSVLRYSRDSDGRLLSMDPDYGIRIVNIYVPNQFRSQKDFFAALDNHLVGPTRVVLWTDRRGEIVLRELVDELGLVDAWCNLRPGLSVMTWTGRSARSRIDRFYVSPSLVPSMHSSWLVSSALSDYRLLILRFAGTNLVAQGKRPWRLNARLLKDQEIIDDVTSLIHRLVHQSAELDRNKWDEVKAGAAECFRSWGKRRAKEERAEITIVSDAILLLSRPESCGPGIAPALIMLRKELRVALQRRWDGLKAIARAERWEMEAWTYMPLTSLVDLETGSLVESSDGVLELAKRFYQKLYAEPAPISAAFRSAFPALYVLVFEPLLQKLSWDSRLCQFSLPPGAPPVALFAYADDLCIVVRDEASVCTVLGLLDGYCEASGARINRLKSAVMYLNAAPTSAQPVHGLPVKARLRILGFHFEPGGLTRENWLIARGKLEARIQELGALSRPLTARITIVRSLLFLLLTYVACVMPVANRTKQRLEQILFRFLWSGSCVYVGRQVAKLPMDKAGLGIPDLGLMADALHVRWTRVALDSDMTFTRSFASFFLSARLRQFSASTVSHCVLRAGTPSVVYAGVARTLAGIQRVDPEYDVVEVQLQELVDLITPPLSEHYEKFDLSRHKPSWKLITASFLDARRASFMYRLARGCLPITYRPFTRNIQRGVCLFCQSREDLAHIFCECALPKALLRKGITKPAIRRLARRGGVKRISRLIYEKTRGVLKVFLENVIRDAVTYTENAKRKTVAAMDVVYALKRQGHTLYGFRG
ncbi:hypothetical protein HPB52_011876 [Rhipicephalus sanguineus]|uniref:Histone H4 n=1 Tax=Rhipicephalus sanguineus TaxID=34632 RepID=A0A9D4T3P4_RHISA|nr:hypothetical protein HPB52_011876 [Rhipicephalus sanguineus]